MNYIIIDWAYNICFDSDLAPFQTFDEAWDFVYDKLHELFPNDEAAQEEELQEYEVVQLTDSHRIDYSNGRRVLKQSYREAS